MIKGHKREELSADNILAKVSELLIYRHYFGQFELNETTYNHLRGEDTSGCPSFIISNRYGHLHHKDFAMGDDWSGNCFKLVQQIYGCSYNEALKIIDRDLGLGILPEHNSGIYRKLKKELKVPDEISKRYSLIQVKTKKFTKQELEYWNSYHIDIEDLRKENVYSVDKVYLNKQLFYTNPHELTFGYLYDGHWKIYRPNETKKNKWLPNNVPITAMDGLDNIKNCDVAFINKSKKDYMVIKKLFECSCAVQNEGLACFSEENVNYLKSNSKRQILSFDSDVTGVKNSQQITQLFGFDYCNVPKQYLSEGIKDWALLGKIHGMKAIEKYLIEKNLI